MHCSLSMSIPSCIWKRLPLRIRVELSLVVFLLICCAAAQSQVLKAQSIPAGLSAPDRHPDESKNNWLSYHGDATGQRSSHLQQINRDNIDKLKLKWVFHTRKVRWLGASPVVVDGVIYLTASNDLFAIDGRTGAELWHHSRQDAASEQEDESTHINRGVALLSNRLFMESDDGHLLALDARSGNVLWDTPFSNEPVGYGGVTAPIVVREKVIVSAIREDGGFVAAFDATDGRESWRFPLPLVPGRRESATSRSESFRTRPRSLMTGVYDPELNLLYQQTGSQPCRSTQDARSQEPSHGGCLLALNASTGKIKWQSPLPEETLLPPAISESPMLLDIPFEQSTRKVIITAQSSGFVTVFNRLTGNLISQQNFHSTRRVDEVQCSAEGLPPSWNPSAYSEQTHLVYFLNFDPCGAGVAPSTRKLQSESKSTNTGKLIAYDPESDKTMWRVNAASTGHPPTGILTTSAGLLFYAGKGQSFEALDAANGNPLWTFPMGQSATGPPISYAIGDDQYISIAAGNDLFVFGLP